MKQVTRTTLGLAVLAMAGIAATSSQDRESRAVDAAWTTIVLDVAMDGSTYVPNRVDPSGTADVKGDWFVVKGKIYPGGTIPAGGTLEHPGAFDPRTASGSVGDWICRGVYIQDYLSGITPHVSTTQSFLFENGAGVTSEGLEGGIVHRVITGGYGQYRGLVGEAKEEGIGFNASGFDNVRFTFKVRKATGD